MIKFNLKNDNITKNINGKIKELQTLPKDVYTFFKAHTPIDTGNARKKTVLVKNEIRGDYPYAQRLDQGWSNQAPDGMTKPTEAYFKQRVDKILRKK